MIGITSILIFFILLLLRTPVSVAIGTAGFWGIFLSKYPLKMLILIMQDIVENINYLPIIFFILVGHIANATKLSERMFDFATSAVGHFKGGLAHANILASMIFAGVSGSGIADCAGLGIIEIKAMTDRGYDLDFSAAVSIASSIVGPIIPPSITLVIYALLANVSVGKMLVAGLIPGIFIGISMMILVFYLSASGRVYAPTAPKQSLKTQYSCFKRNFTALLAPLILLSGFFLGVISPSESGAFAIFYIIVIALFRRDATLKEILRKGFGPSLLATAQIMFILCTASAFCWVLTREQIYLNIGELIINLTRGNKYLFWLLVNLFYLVNGCFIPGIATMVITIPIWAPLLPIFNIDPVQFGVVIIFNDMIGMLTPPVGSGIFIMMSISKVKYEKLIRSAVPFIIELYLALIILILFPIITTFLPNLLFK